MNTNTIPADVLPEGGSLMSDEFTVVIEDVSQYPKDITTSGGSCKHDGEKSYSKYTPEQHKVYCNKCDQEIGTEDHDFSQHLTGYQVTYSTSSKFTKAATKSVNVKGTSKVISKLTKGKTYYVKVRTYKTVGKTKYYSGYSAVKKITVK
ncbi:hypothetical protein [Ruminococcus sp. NK3A76]|uniref:hypothetical protein n=1 Tax=Ruminococcus sp. NK3A76 TaxID=877411 RepID=UPI00048DF3A7|nr:hypothetical protein [Ruminococcus sp. NK3A76]